MALSASGAPDPAVRPSLTQPHVFVLDKHGQPLQPCHPARARQLLKAGRAVVARRTPFVIRLKDRTVADSEVDGVEIGIDPGSKTTGIAVFTTTASQQPTDPSAPDDGPDRFGIYGIQLRHRGDRIRNRLATRAVFRRHRRARNLRYRPPRYRNRARPKGSLPPSLMHRVVTTRNWIDRLTRWAPVRAVHLERASFDIQPRTRGGSNRVSNLVLACVRCNTVKGVQPVEAFLANNADRLDRIRAQAKQQLRDAAAMNGTRRVLWRSLAAIGLPVHIATGGRTKWNRSRNDLPKTHTLDALCVGQLKAVVQVPAEVLMVTATGRGSYQRTRPNASGFPRLRFPRSKQLYGFQTGDLVQANVSIGKHTGTHTGRVVVRTCGYFQLRTHPGIVRDIHYRHCQVLQRADGYGYHWREEPTPPSG